MDIESEWITAATRIQTFSKTGVFKLTRAQRKESTSNPYLNALVNLHDFDLAKFMQGKVELPSDIAGTLLEFYRGVVINSITEQLQNIDPSATEIAKGFLEEMDEARGPLELKAVPKTWLQFYGTVDAIPKATDSEFDFHESQDLFRWLFELNRKVGAEKAEVILRIGMMAARLRDNPRRKALTRYIIKGSIYDTDLAKVISDPKIVGAILEKGGTPLLLKLVDSCALMESNEFVNTESNPSPNSSGKLLLHLAKTGKVIPKFLSYIEFLSELSGESGLYDELAAAIVDAKSGEAIDKLFGSLKTADGKILSRDAQKIFLAIIEKYEIDPSHNTLRKFCERISRITLSEAVMNRMQAMIANKAKFTQALIAKKLNQDDAMEKFEDSNSVDSDFFWLTILAILEFKSHELGGITKTLSVLHDYRARNQIDDRHYQMIIDDCTVNLPTSLKRLYIVPETTPTKIRQLYTALSIAAELPKADRPEYLSDTYHALSIHDRNAR